MDVGCGHSSEPQAQGEQFYFCRIDKVVIFPVTPNTKNLLTTFRSCSMIFRAKIQFYCDLNRF